MNASGEVVSFPLLRACVFQDMSAAAPVENASPLSGPDHRAVFSGNRLNRISILFNY
jgi:hypothetical protein